MDFFFLDTYFFLFNRYFQAGDFFFVIFKVFFLCFFLKEISKLCQTHLDQRTQQERGETERGGEGREEGRGRDQAVGLGKRKVHQHFLKPQAKNAFIRTQATEPDSSSCLYMDIQPCGPQRTRAHAHTRERTHTHTRTGKRMPKKKEIQT